jgi:hypothetical protein
MTLRSICLLCTLVTLFARTAADAAANYIRFESPNGALVAYIKVGGRVEDASFRAMGYVRDGGRVEDAGFRTLGFVSEDGAVKDATYSTVGYFRPGGRVEDSSYRTVGYAREGVIQDVHLTTVGFYDVGSFEGDVDAALAAYVFFFSRVLFVQPNWETFYKP